MASSLSVGGTLSQVVGGAECAGRSPRPLYQLGPLCRAPAGRLWWWVGPDSVITEKLGEICFVLGSSAEMEMPV